MVDPPTYQTDPDPEFADRLEELLLQRLTAHRDATSSGPLADPSSRLGADADPDHRGDMIMLDVEDRPSGPGASRHSRPRRWLVPAAAIAVVALAGGVLVALDDDGETPLDTSTTPTTAPADTACPLTAEEVSEVIGETITGPTSSSDCHFGQKFPGVYFSYHPGSACTSEDSGEVDGDIYVDRVDGLGVEAYSLVKSVGVSLLVCDGDRPFSVFPNGVKGDELSFAIALARLVLDDPADAATTTAEPVTTEPYGRVIREQSTAIQAWIDREESSDHIEDSFPQYVRERYDELRPLLTDLRLALTELPSPPDEIAVLVDTTERQVIDALTTVDRLLACPEPSRSKCSDEYSEAEAAYRALPELFAAWRPYT